MARRTRRMSAAATLASGRNVSWDHVEEQMDPTMPQDPVRRRLALFLKSAWAEYFLGAIISFNVILIIVETDSTAGGGSEARWVTTSNTILFWFYCLELTLKFFVYQRKFCMDTMNMFDAFVVMCDLVPAVVNFAYGSTRKGTFSITRCIRLIRLTRTLRLLRRSNELNMLMVSFAAGMKAVSWGLVLVAVLVLIWAILSVQLLDDLNHEIWRDRIDCDRCQHAFSSVWTAAITIIQTVIAGDSWGLLALPLIEHSGWTLLLFGGIIVSLDLALLNLILAVMIECAQEAKQVDDHQKALLCEKAKAQAKSDLYDLCKEIDEDKSGSLSIEEFMHAFENNDKFADILAVMDINQDDMHIIFQVLDSDCSGNVDCQEFVERLYRMKTHESQQILFTVSEIRKMMLEEKGAQTSRSLSRMYTKDPSPEKKLENSPGIENQGQALPTHACVHLQQPDLDSARETPVQEAEKMYQQLRQISSEVDASLQSLTQHTEAFMQNLSQGAGTQARALSSLREEFPHFLQQNPTCGEEQVEIIGIGDSESPSSRAKTLDDSTHRTAL